MSIKVEKMYDVHNCFIFQNEVFIKKITINTVENLANEYVDTELFTGLSTLSTALCITCYKIKT